MSNPDSEILSARFGEAITARLEFRGETTLRIALDRLHEVLSVCCKELNYELLLDISSVDHFGADPRFEIVYELATLDDQRHLRIKALVSEEEKVPSATDLWNAANWHEREVWDMMGIPFENHPQLERILMWEGYPFFPLRKDFPLAGRPTEMPDVAFSDAAPLVGGPFVTLPDAHDTIRAEPRSRESK